MTHKDLPYYKSIRAKTRREYELHKNKHKNHSNSLHTFHNLVPAHPIQSYEALADSPFNGVYSHTQFT